MTAEPRDVEESVFRAAIEAGAERLKLTHWDGSGCGTNGTGGCSRCYGPSPADAAEVAEDVLDASWSIIAAAADRENAELRAQLDAARRWQAERVVAISQDPTCIKWMRESERMLAEVEAAEAERDELRAEVERLRAELERKGESIENRDDVLRDLRVEVDDLRAQLPAAASRFDGAVRALAKHQLAEVLPGGVACTCGADLAALNAPLDDGSIHGEGLALAVHQLQQIEAMDGKLQRERDDLRAQLAAAQTESAALRTRLATSQAEATSALALRDSAKRRAASAMEECDRALRHLGAVQAELTEARSTIVALAAEDDPEQIARFRERFPSAETFDAALSAAPQPEPGVRAAYSESLRRLGRADLVPDPPASDEPARCEHGRTEPHCPHGSSYEASMVCACGRDCPAASGTPDGGS